MLKIMLVQMVEIVNLSTYILLGIIVIVSILGFRDRDFMEKHLFYPYAVKHYGEYYRFLTHAFLHLDVMHLAFNGITLYSFGQVLETYLTAKYGLNLGEGVFWIFVITAMLASSMISFIRHKDNVGYKSLGFSGVTSAIVFGVILLAPDMKLMLMFIPVPIPAWLFGLIYLAFEIYADRNKKTNIAHDAHIAGAIYGIIFIFLTNIEEVMTNFRTLIG